MESIPVNSFSSELTDRIVWFDGDITVEPNRVSELLQQGIEPSDIKVTKITPDIMRFNKLSTPNERIKTKTSIKELNRTWTIPSEYLEIDLIDFLGDKLRQLKLSKEDIEIREVRIVQEFMLFQKFKLLTFLKVLIYVVHQLNINNVVYGVGRGSSVSSYILYLIGIHDVDSVKYELDIDDFLRI